MKVQPVCFFIAAVLSGVSSFAMAWTDSGAGGTVEISGTLQPMKVVTPWEVKVGSISNLDANIFKGRNIISLRINQGKSTGSLVLGIRTKDLSTFPGAVGISPQISYGGHVKYEEASAEGRMPMQLDVMSQTGGGKIGTLRADLSGVAEHVWMLASDNSKVGHYRTLADAPGRGFFGGLPTLGDTLAKNPRSRAKNMDSEVVANMYTPGSYPHSAQSTAFNDPLYVYSAYYAAGFDPSQQMTITLDNPVTDDTPIKWQASLPVTVSYV